VKTFNRWLNEASKQEKPPKKFDVVIGKTLDVVKKRLAEAGFKETKITHIDNDPITYYIYLCHNKPLLKTTAENRIIVMFGHLGKKIAPDNQIEVSIHIDTWSDILVDSSDSTDQIKAKLEAAINKPNGWGWPLRLGLPSLTSFIEVLDKIKLTDDHGQIKPEAFLELDQDDRDTIVRYYNIMKDEKLAQKDPSRSYSIFNNVAPLLINPGEEDINL
jgi:hypothetical protein